MEAVKKESKVSQLWNKVKTKIISILKNKSSLFFLAYALTALKKQNKKINNIDITIVCEQILLKDYHNLIINKITELTNCKNVSIKSTRFENKRNKYIECNCLITI